MSNKKVFILPAETDSVKKVQGMDFEWVYLGEDILNDMAIQEVLGGTGKKVSTAGKLKENILALKDDYVEYIGGLAEDSLSWWNSALSEKNVFISKTFLYSCFIRTSLEILEENRGDERPVVFFVNNRELRKDLKANIGPDYDVVYTEPITTTLKIFLTDVSTLVKNKLFFICSNMKRAVISRYFLKAQSIPELEESGENILVFTWNTRFPFDDNGQYKDSFYGDLFDIAMEKFSKKNLFIVPYQFGAVPYKKTLKKMRKAKENFLLLWDYLGLLDFVKVTIESLRRVPMRKKYPEFSGMSISNLIFQDLKEEWLRKRVSTNLLFHRLVEKWSKKGFRIKKFIYLFENQTWEKVFIKAFRKYYPETKLIAYQHATIPSTMLNFFLSEREKKMVPLPDRILTNGKYETDLLKGAGFPEAILDICGALRFPHISVNKLGRRESDKNVMNVLITTPIGMQESIELVKKVHGALHDNDEYAIILKCHPAMPYETFSGRLDFDPPSNFMVSDAPINDALKKADIVIYTSSSTSIEALAHGIDVVHINSDYSLEMDPLDFATEVREVATTSEEILSAIEKIRSMDESSMKARKIRGKKIVDLIFAPVTEETYDKFLL